MDTGSYQFKSLENKYDGFRAPAFEVSVDGKTLESSKFHFSSITVDIDAGEGAGGCSFTVESQYDYEGSKWNNSLLDTIQVGNKIEIKAGYVRKESIFFGFVDDFTINYSANGAPSITVNGIDAKGYLMNAQDRKYMQEKSTTTVVKEILNECVSKGYAKKVKVGVIKDFDAELIQEEMDDYHFLCFLARTYNLTFTVIDGEIVFDSLMRKTSSIIELNLGVSLLQFSKTVSLRKQIGKVVVYGIDPKTLKPISGEATDTSASGSGKEAGDIARGFNGMVLKEINFFVQTPEECKELAQAIFDQRAYSFVSGKGRCVGLPELIPGRYITLKGFDKSTADKYFISKVTHEFSEDGYYTSFEVKGAKSK